MSSKYVLNGCGDCGVSGLGAEITEQAANETTKDTLEEAKKYSNSEIPLWVKVTTAVGGYFLIRKFTRSK